ncbi:MAG: hypothetical protein GY696_38815 [Gammaproteobacteria bacterium]|nr:hypothetical protein [Gammaproteobacteria bacterium]
MAHQQIFHFVWVKAHVGISGNETVDRLANEGGRQEPIDLPMPFQAAKIMIQHLRNDKWMEDYRQGPTAKFYRKCKPTPTKKDFIRTLPRDAQWALTRLRINRFPTAKYLASINKAPTPLCPCGEAETIQHMLHRCPLTASARRKIWPRSSYSSLKNCLFHDVEEANKVVKFLKDIGRI